MTPFLFVVIACVPWHPFCIGSGDPTSIGAIMRSDPIEHVACIEKLREFRARMFAVRPKLDGFYFGRCEKDGTDV